MFFLSSCGDFKRARSKRIVEKAFEHFDNEEFEKAKEAAELASQLGSEDWRLFEIRARLFFQSGQPEEALTSYEKASNLLESSDDSEPILVSKLLASKGQVLSRMGKYAESAVELEKAIEVTEDDAESLNNLAWLLAVAPDESVCDGKRAVGLAEKACELSNWNNPAPIDTLAAAHAEVGEFELAIKYQKRVLEMLRAQGNLTEVQLQEMGFAERLSLFESGKPFREDFVKEYQTEHPRKMENDS